MNLSIVNKYVSPELKHFWEILHVLVSRNVNVRYRGSVLGIYWSLFNPLIMTALYSAIFGSPFAPSYGSIWNYILAAFTGLVVINFFSSSTTQALVSVVGNGSLLNKIRLPVSVFPVSMIAANMFQFVLGPFLLLAIVALIKSKSLINVFAIFLPFIALVLFCIGVGFFVSSLYVFYRDLPYFYELLVFILWISSPVFYPAEIVPKSVQPFVNLNPLSPIIESFRQITLSGNLPDIMLILTALLSGMIFAVIGFLYFQRSRSQFMDLL